MSPAGRTGNRAVRERMRMGLRHANHAVARAAQRRVDAEDDLMIDWGRTKGGGENRRRAAPSGADAAFHLFKLLRRDAHAARVPKENQEVEKRSTPVARMFQRREALSPQPSGCMRVTWLAPDANHSQTADRFSARRRRPTCALFHRGPEGNSSKRRRIPGQVSRSFR